MNRCERCGVNVHPQHAVCPLCGRLLGEPRDAETSYPRYAEIGDKAGFTLAKLLLFLMISVSAVSVFINIFTFSHAPSLWSVIVLLSLVFVWRTIGFASSKKANAGMKILHSYAFTSAFLLGLDIFTGFGKWSTTYVIPFLTILVTFVYTILAVRSHKNFREYLGNLLAIFFISLCPVIIYLFSLSAQVWSCLVAILYCLLTVAGLAIFMGSSFKDELKKRFHF
ncbi:MAG TPA: hypothetical protein DEQ02_07965 [Ruminococcaceae bacterium]|nr:hypothetical protein [Oscillospiraceae bacterium]